MGKKKRKVKKTKPSKKSSIDKKMLLINAILDLVVGIALIIIEKYIL